MKHLKDNLKHRAAMSEKRAKLQGIRSPLHETRYLFENGLDCEFPLSYDEWMSLDIEYKAAALYVQYFNQITLAWNKVKSFYADEVLGVETMIQYLEKNVPLIEADSKRFTAKYIYRVAFNCLYCICHDIKRDRERWELEVCNQQTLSNGDTVDLFDLAAAGSSKYGTSSIEHELDIEEFWNKIYSLGDDVVSLVEYILNGGRLKGTARKNKDELMNKLREELAVYINVYF